MQPYNAMYNITVFFVNQLCWMDLLALTDLNIQRQCTLPPSSLTFLLFYHILFSATADHLDLLWVQHTCSVPAKHSHTGH